MSAAGADSAIQLCRRICRCPTFARRFAAVLGTECISDQRIPAVACPHAMFRRRVRNYRSAKGVLAHTCNPTQLSPALLTIVLRADSCAKNFLFEKPVRSSNRLCADRMNAQQNLYAAFRKWPSVPAVICDGLVALASPSGTTRATVEMRLLRQQAKNIALIVGSPKSPWDQS